MVKAIFFDIDGTLVSFETHKIPASTQEALKALRDKGIKIFCKMKIYNDNIQ